MGSIFLASVFCLAACALAYAEELTELSSWVRRATAPPAAPRGLPAPPHSMLRSLVKDLDSPDPKKRSRAFDRLPQYPPAELTRNLVPLLDGPVTETRDRVADLLLRNGGEDVLEPLHRYFLERGETPQVQTGALKAFPTEVARRRKGSGTGLGVVLPISPGMAPVREPVVAAEARGPQLGDVAFPPEVLSPDAEIRARAIADLAHLGHPHAYELLCRVTVTDPEALVRSVAAAALGRLPEEHGGLEALADATRDDDPSVRWNACFALGKLGSTEAKRALRFAENDPDGSVRLAARNSLEVLGLDPPLSAVPDA